MNTTWQNFRRQLIADKRKLIAMAMLGGFAMLLWGRLLLRDVPRTAVADPKADNRQAANDAASQTTGTTPLGVLPRPDVKVVLHDRVRHDLFKFQAGYFPQDQAKQISQINADKSPSETTDQKEQHERLIQSVRTAAQSLKLQSTLLGAQRRALINNELLSPGQKINGFELMTVGPRQVTLQCEGVTVVLEMGE